MNRETELDARNEERINALLDGELDSAETDRLRAEAAADPVLAQAIIDAYELQRRLEQLPAERAPDSLRRRLAAIPAEQAELAQRSKRSGRGWPRLPRLALAGGGLAVAALAVAMMMQPAILDGPVQQGPGQAGTETVAISDDSVRPAPTEEQVRQQLALAFHYIDQAGRRTGREIEVVLEAELAHPVRHQLSESMPFTESESRKEKSS